MIGSQAFAQVPNLMITEIMYNGPEGGADSTEFVEIYNNDTVAVNLAGYNFVQGFNYTFPSVTINANSYVVVAVDSVKFANFFGVTAYEWVSGGLSNGGEDIILVTANGDTVDVVDYDDGGLWPSAADGGGPSLTFCNYSLDNNNGANWSVATSFVGVNAAGDSIWANPGTGCGSIPPPSSDTIPPVANNAMANSATSVNVYFSEPVDATAELVANYTGLGTVSSAVRNTNGDMVTLTLATALVDGAPNTLTVANVNDTANNTMAAPQSFSIVYNGTTANLLLTEIMYNDPSSLDTLEYFEIYNNGNATVNLGGYIVTEGVDFIFPANTYLTIGSYIVVAKDSASVNSVFGITGTLQWTDGGLKNSGEDIEIQNSLGDTLIYVDYDDSSPWPVEADGDGYSLEFCDVNNDNNDGSNWTISGNLAAVINGDSIYGTPGASCIMISVENSKSIENIKMYPNPATDVIFFSNQSLDYDVSIYDVTGSLVQRALINNSNNSISIKALKPGMYYVQMVNSKTFESISKKLIVR
jgi:hypothetical protein